MDVEDFILTTTAEVGEFGDLEFLSDENTLAFFTRFLETFFFAVASVEAATEFDFNELEFDFDTAVCFGFDSFFTLTIFSPSSCLVVPV